jgi:hypothetical protein
MSSTAINQYEVFYSSNGFPPRIGLINDAAYFAQFLFMPNGSVLPSDGVLNGQIQIYYHLEDFANILNILQHEKQVFLVYNGPNAGNDENFLQTTPNIGK